MKKYIFGIFTIFSFIVLKLDAGQLIEICGIDGSGKTTFIEHLKENLEELGYSVITLKVIQGDKRVYPFLNELNLLKEDIDQSYIHFLISNFRSDFFLLSFLKQKNNIETALRQYDYVICDRYITAYKVYQKCFNAYKEEDISLVDCMPVANVTFYIDVPVEIAIERISKRKIVEVHENECFLSKAQEIFKETIIELNNYISVRGDVPYEKIQQDVLSMFR
jgi:dTMP kinase